MAKEKKIKKPPGRQCDIQDVRISACCNGLSNRYWDKNGIKCLKCGKIFTI